MTDCHGATALHHALFRGMISVAHKVMDKEPQLANTVTAAVGRPSSWTPLQVYYRISLSI